MFVCSFGEQFCDCVKFYGIDLCVVWWWNLPFVVVLVCSAMILMCGFVTWL